eukprot:GHVN01058978.1.p1 GENE.GHVN01058978.1~~GHVN01058978.1.p1  ORF type:complete len:1112 (-),score=141.42 GHVN01058978.1:2538-5873(-)
MYVKIDRISLCSCCPDELSYVEIRTPKPLDDLGFGNFLPIPHPLRRRVPPTFEQARSDGTSPSGGSRPNSASETVPPLAEKRYEEIQAENAASGDSPTAVMEKRPGPDPLPPDPPVPKDDSPDEMSPLEPEGSPYDKPSPRDPAGGYPEGSTAQLNEESNTLNESPSETSDLSTATADKHVSSTKAKKSKPKKSPPPEKAATAPKKKETAKEESTKKQPTTKDVASKKKPAETASKKKESKKKETYPTANGVAKAEQKKPKQKEAATKNEDGKGDSDSVANKGSTRPAKKPDLQWIQFDQPLKSFSLTSRKKEASTPSVRDDPLVVEEKREKERQQEDDDRGGIETASKEKDSCKQGGKKKLRLAESETSELGEREVAPGGLRANNLDLGATRGASLMPGGADYGRMQTGAYLGQDCNFCGTSPRSCLCPLRMTISQLLQDVSKFAEIGRLKTVMTGTGSLSYERWESTNNRGTCSVCGAPPNWADSDELKTQLTNVRTTDQDTQTEPLCSNCGIQILDSKSYAYPPVSAGSQTEIDLCEIETQTSVTIHTDLVNTDCWGKSKRDAPTQTSQGCSFFNLAKESHSMDNDPHDDFSSGSTENHIFGSGGERRASNEIGFIQLEDSVPVIQPSVKYPSLNTIDCFEYSGLINDPDQWGPPPRNSCIRSMPIATSPISFPSPFFIPTPMINSVKWMDAPTCPHRSKRSSSLHSCIPAVYGPTPPCLGAGMASGMQKLVVNDQRSPPEGDTYPNLHFEIQKRLHSPDCSDPCDGLELDNEDPSVSEEQSDYDNPKLQERLRDLLTNHTLDKTAAENLRAACAVFFTMINELPHDQRHATIAEFAFSLEDCRSESGSGYGSVAQIRKEESSSDGGSDNSVAEQGKVRLARRLKTMGSTPDKSLSASRPSTQRSSSSQQLGKGLSKVAFFNQVPNSARLERMMSADQGNTHYQGIFWDKKASGWVVYWRKEGEYKFRVFQSSKFRGSSDEQMSKALDAARIFLKQVVARSGVTLLATKSNPAIGSVLELEAISQITLGDEDPCEGPLPTTIQDLIQMSNSKPEHLQSSPSRTAELHPLLSPKTPRSACDVVVPQSPQNSPHLAPVDIAEPPDPPARW